MSCARTRTRRASWRRALREGAAHSVATTTCGSSTATCSWGAPPTRGRSCEYAGPRPRLPRGASAIPTTRPSARPSRCGPATSLTPGIGPAGRALDARLREGGHVAEHLVRGLLRMRRFPEAAREFEATLRHAPGRASARRGVENLQPINAYKLRGAVNAVAMLPGVEPARGVWTPARSRSPRPCTVRRRSWPRSGRPAPERGGPQQRAARPSSSCSPPPPRSRQPRQRPIRHDPPPRRPSGPTRTSSLPACGATPSRPRSSIVSRS
jgi:hypothetical protein